MTRLAIAALLAAGVAACGCETSPFFAAEPDRRNSNQLSADHSTYREPFIGNDPNGCDVCPKWCRRRKIPKLYEHEIERATIEFREVAVRLQPQRDYERWDRLQVLSCSLMRSGPIARDHFRWLLGSNELDQVLVVAAHLALDRRLTQDRPLHILHELSSRPGPGRYLAWVFWAVHRAERKVTAEDLGPNALPPRESTDEELAAYYERQRIREAYFSGELPK